MLLTVVLSSSAIALFVSASAVVSGTPPEGCGVGRLTYGTSGGMRVDGPISAFLCSFTRAWDVPYGWNCPVWINPVLVGLVLS